MYGDVPPLTEMFISPPATPLHGGLVMMPDVINRLGCVMTTVDQEKGVVSGKDPLKTLAQYRNFGNKVLFGQNLIGLGLGTVSIGDEIRVLSHNKK